jgi:hypothetical protein
MLAAQGNSSSYQRKLAAQVNTKRKRHEAKKSDILSHKNN